MEADVSFGNAFENIKIIRPAIVEEADKTGKSSGEIPCPACKSGVVRWSRASSNGHVHAQCTNGCAAWMECGVMNDLPTITPRANAEARREFPGMFRERDIIADACAAVATRARRSAQDYIEAGARQMLAPRQQWRITRAVYGFGLPPVWPPQPD